MKIDVVAMPPLARSQWNVLAETRGQIGPYPATPKSKAARRVDTPNALRKGVVCGHN